jgi:flagellar export protein FliJ
VARFVFRVQAALDLRRRQEDAAKQALALAESHKLEAEHARDEARTTLETSLQRAHDAEGRAGDVTERLWYRNWIAAKRRELDRRQQTVAEREAEVRRAEGVARDAYRKRRMLERLREHAHGAFVAGERRDEQKVFDDLGTLRYSMKRRGGYS